MPTTDHTRYFFIASALLAALLGTASIAHAFRSTDIESFTDPDYAGFQPKKVLIQVQEAQPDMRRLVEEHITKEFAKRGVTAVPERQLFTRVDAS
jgi:hypothetical protein